MAYDPIKAHEYYIKYRKKGLLKGRKKGSSKKKSSSTKKGKTIALIGVSSSGLNSDGQIEASLIKEKLKAEMNTKLKSAKSEEEKIAIRKEYSKKANAEIEKLKSNPQFAKAKSSSTKGSSSKGSSKSSAGSSKSSGSTSGKSSTSSKGTSTTTSAKSSTTSSSNTVSISAEAKKKITELSNKISEALSSDKFLSLSTQEKEDFKEQVNGILTRLKKLYGIKV